MGRACSPYSYADSYPGRCRISCFAGNPALAWAGIASRLRRLVLWRNQPLVWTTVISIVRLALIGVGAWSGLQPLLLCRFLPRPLPNLLLRGKSGVAPGSSSVGPYRVGLLK